MKKALYMFFLLFVLTFQIQAQKVGLVLSGFLEDALKFRTEIKDIPLSRIQ